jgi:hypothetical protein
MEKDNIRLRRDRNLSTSSLLRVHYVWTGPKEQRLGGVPFLWPAPVVALTWGGSQRMGKGKPIQGQAQESKDREQRKGNYIHNPGLNIKDKRLRVLALSRRGLFKVNI